jgi:cell division protein FtsI (penicillin-binding protein 3)
MNRLLPSGPRARMVWVAGGLAVLAALIVGRAAELAIVRGGEFARQAANQHVKRIRLRPHRGAIVDRNGDLLARSADVPSIAVWPRVFKAEAGQAEKIPALASAVGMPVKALRAKLDSNRAFVWLRRRAHPRVERSIAALKLKGVGVFPEGRRFYPHGTLAAHVLGLVGLDAGGLYGIERQYDKLLRGDERVITVDRSVGGGTAITTGVEAEPADGSRVELTIDSDVQAATERELAAGVANVGAANGTAVVLDPRTGELLALANVPTYNPNTPGSGTDRGLRDRFRNRAVSDPYEPGSTFKAVLAAAAFHEGVTRPNEMFDCENGSYPFGTAVVHDAHPHGLLSFAQVMQYSSNIGAAKVGDRLGKDRLYQYIRAFGFGTRTGIELPDETRGLLRPVASWARIDIATHSYGQGLSVTPLQIASAFGALANRGTLMKPYIVRRVVAASGDVLEEHPPKVVGQLVSPEAALAVTEMLRRVVEADGGTGSRARLDDFPVAGKTGTAQKVDPKTRRYSDKIIASFIGYVPADDPRLVIAVVVDEPVAGRFGGIVAAPIFRAIAEAALPMVGVYPPGPSMPAAPPPGVAMVSAPRPVAPTDPNSTPNFVGLSLREAVTQARGIGYADVRLKGAGYVREQQPPAGAPRAREKRLALTLRFETGATPP